MQLNRTKALMMLAVAGSALVWSAGGRAETVVPTATGPVATAPAAPSPAPAADATAAAPAALPEGVTPEVMAQGQELFLKNCRKCHGMRGKAGVPLSGNQNIADPSYIAAMILNGRGYMPAFGEHLGDDQIAAIATFARNSWGNAFGPVTPQDVKDMR